MVKSFNQFIANSAAKLQNSLELSVADTDLLHRCHRVTREPESEMEMFLNIMYAQVVEFGIDCQVLNSSCYD